MEELVVKKAIVVGGSNGIGLAIVNRLIDKNYFVYVLDVSEPDTIYLKENSYEYIKCNLLDFNEKMFEELAADSEVDTLMITAGFGRVADFEYLHIAEIENMLNVNTIAAIKIIRLFYEKIKNTIPFYCGIMGSIAGLVSSPMFSVYAASKAGICRFVESVNIELEQAGVFLYDTM